jgi:epoxyqueuosine reductase
MPDDVMDALEDRVYGCDICQDVCPWNRGVEKRRAGQWLPDDATPMVSLAEWLGGDGEELVADLERLYVPRTDPRWLRRNALVALGNGGRERELASPYVDDPDPALRGAARRVLGSVAARLPREGGRG